MGGGVGAASEVSSVVLMGNRVSQPESDHLNVVVGCFGAEQIDNEDCKAKSLTCMHGHLFCIFQYLNLLYVVLWRTASFMAGSDHPLLRGHTLPHCKAAPDLIYVRAKDYLVESPKLGWVHKVMYNVYSTQCA
ncbi:hypothetical protein Syun_022942 [Stephania yunnanensis]|uniref:Uncharacterized protein n=1 Tax=Stephania yunnanensis TaxID=152371 RepID=A0AAP0F8V8_9MAGN